MAEVATIACRLCGGESHFAFHKLVLEHHRVAYYKCGSCNSLETERPYWLDEAYAIPGVHIDVGGASRTLKNWVGLSALLQRLEFPRSARALDFGAATGLLGRLMRDTGYNFYSHDKYAQPSFSNYYTADDLAVGGPQLITAFEVFEHFPEPAQELDLLLALGAPLIVFTTWFCDGQPEDWIYFVPECGQHVFFYTEQAFRAHAAAHGYQLRTSAFFHILFKPEAHTPAQRATLNDFTLHGGAWAHAANAELLASVVMGNAYIENDFEAARMRFIDERRTAAVAKGE